MLPIDDLAVRQEDREVGIHGDLLCVNRPIRSDRYLIKFEGHLIAKRDSVCQKHLNDRHLVSAPDVQAAWTLDVQAFRIFGVL